MRKPCKLNDEQSISISKEPIMICTWNVRTVYKAGKINNAIAETDRLKIDIMGISKMKRPGNGHYIVDNHKVYYHSENENNRHIVPRCKQNKIYDNFDGTNCRTTVVY